MTSDTIIAPATPPGYGGVSLLRISGDLAEKISKKLSKREKPFKIQQATLTSFYDNLGDEIDSGLVTFFKGPASYTGEDTIELSCHGNPIIVDQLISITCGFGARMAEPGEFTKRAFLNGKLDLVQAESVSKLIESQSILGAKINNKILAGGLSKKLQKIKNSIIKVLAELEFEFDISENELYRQNLITDSRKDINNNILSCRSLISTYSEGRIASKGARVVICGNPNVGKSTLLNALLEKDRAITSSTPGTTRDTIESSLTLGGIPIVLVDTAGIRNANNKIESDGISRSYKEMENADLLINVKTNNETVSHKNHNEKEIIVYNKSDLDDAPETTPTTNTISISALLGDGVPDLKKLIKEKLTLKNSAESNIILTTRRQVAALNDCEQKLKNSLHHLNDKHPELELLSFELRDAINSIDVLLGKTTVDDILNKVFSGFCVGK